MSEVRLLLCAVQFLTRLPVPALAGFAPDWIPRSTRYFPLVGQLVGAMCTAVFVGAARHWPGAIPAVLAVSAGILITGAFHEDGLADTADGLGGGQDRAQRLAIMKDSRVGTYGVLALLIVLAVKIAALAQMSNGAFVLIAGHGAARAAAVLAMTLLPYGGDPEAAKVKPVPQGVTPVSCAVALILAVWPFFVFALPHPVLGLALGAVAALMVALLARRLIGGVTGDVLGAIEQVFEAGFFLGAV